MADFPDVPIYICTRHCVVNSLTLDQRLGQVAEKRIPLTLTLQVISAILSEGDHVSWAHRSCLPAGA